MYRFAFCFVKNLEHRDLQASIVQHISSMSQDPQRSSQEK